MRLKLPASAARISQVAVLPLLLALDCFPRGADAPIEVVPDLRKAEQATRQMVQVRLQQSAAEALEALRSGALEQPSLRITHAYFGPMRPLLTLRVLTAHTGHHARGFPATASAPTEVA
jgi:hypothetical protein